MEREPEPIGQVLESVRQAVQANAPRISSQTTPDLLPSPSEAEQTLPRPSSISGTTGEAKGMPARTGKQHGGHGALAVSNTNPPDLPAWQREAIAKLTGSPHLDKLLTACQRATPSLLRSLADGPRPWCSQSKSFVWKDGLTETESKAISWAGRIAERALAERDDGRIARAVRVLMMLPTSGDAVDGDHAEAWIALLDDMPVWAVERACFEYAKAHKWRPTPVEIRELVQSETRFVRMLVRNASHLPAEARP